MQNNFEIYLIGFSVLIFLILTFFFIRKISNSSELKMKIEPVSDSFDEDDSINIDNQSSFDFNEKVDEAKELQNKEQELAILNLISVDKSDFNINQFFGIMNNLNTKSKNGYFSYLDTNNKEIFKIVNAINPGTFDENTSTFAILVVADLASVSNPTNAFQEMINFAYMFSEKFHSSICDAERMPITKQMISHMESRAQEIMRLSQLNNFKEVSN